MRSRDGILNASSQQAAGPHTPAHRQHGSRPDGLLMSDFRIIPSIEQLRQREAMRALETRYGRAALVEALRAETAALRDDLGSGNVAAVTVAEAIDAIERGADARLRASMRPSLVS